MRCELLLFLGSGMDGWGVLVRSWGGGGEVKGMGVVMRKGWSGDWYTDCR